VGLRERILQPLDRTQRIVFALLFGFALLGNIAIEFYTYHSYHVHLMHLGLLFGVIQVIFNPQGVRLLFFGFFVFLMMKMFQIPIHSDFAFIPSYSHDQLLLGFILIFLTTSIKTMVYTHIVLYALLAYFAFRNPFGVRKKVDSEVIDDLD
jgi:hypothetical protein